MHFKREGSALMAFTITNSGVLSTRGRGAAKVSIEISFKDLERWARRQLIDTPKLMQRSFGRACSALRGKLVKVMKNAGGVEGVPKFKDFEDFTKELRAKTGRNSPMGGALADRTNIVAYKKNGWQIIGWPNDLADWAVNFQDGIGSKQYDPFQNDDDRRFWHRLGIANIPRAYVHNPRRVIPEPFGAYVDKYLIRWAKGAFYKELARQMQKASAA